MPTLQAVENLLFEDKKHFPGEMRQGWKVFQNERGVGENERVYIPHSPNFRYNVAGAIFNSRAASDLFPPV